MEGFTDGFTLGATVGATLSATEGMAVRISEGLTLGLALGAAESGAVGSVDKTLLVGTIEGHIVCETDGIREGTEVGAMPLWLTSVVGGAVGLADGR